MSEDQLGGLLGEHLADRIPKAARLGHKRFPMVASEDFEQAMWERMLARAPEFRQMLDEGKEGVIWEELRRAATRLGKEDDRYRRAIRAIRLGYRVDDEQFYSRRQLVAVLPELIEAEMDAGRAMERALSGSAGSAVKVMVSSSEDAFERYLVTIIEVIWAFRKLERKDQDTLRNYYSLSQEDTEQGRWERSSYASTLGLTAEALRQRASRSVHELEEKLGGSNPWAGRDREPRDVAGKKAA